MQGRRTTTKKPRNFQKSRTKQDVEDEVLLVNNNPEVKDSSNTQAADVDTTRKDSSDIHEHHATKSNEGNVPDANGEERQ